MKDGLRTVLNVGNNSGTDLALKQPCHRPTKVSLNQQATYLGQRTPLPDQTLHAGRNTLVRALVMVLEICVFEDLRLVPLESH